MSKKIKYNNFLIETRKIKKREEIKQNSKKYNLNLIKNSNFRNSQNYIISKKIKLSFTYHFLIDSSNMYKIIKYNLLIVFYFFVLSLIDIIFLDGNGMFLFIVFIYSFTSTLIIMFFYIFYQKLKFILFGIIDIKKMKYKIFRKNISNILNIKDYIVINKQGKIKF